MKEALNLQNTDSLAGDAPAVSETDESRSAHPEIKRDESEVSSPEELLAKYNYRLSDKINPDSDDALEFDWPTNSDLAQSFRLYQDEGKNLGDI